MKDYCLSRVLCELTKLALIQTWEVRDDGCTHAILHPLVKDWIQLRTSSDDNYRNIAAAWLLLWTALDLGWNAMEYRYVFEPVAHQELVRHVIVPTENGPVENTIGI